MTRETKIGLLVGLAFIIVIGILLSDHLTSSTEPPQATLANAGSNVRQAVANPGQAAPPPTPTSVQTNPTPSQPVATREELTPGPNPTTIVKVGPSNTPAPVKASEDSANQPTDSQAQSSQVASNDPPTITRPHPSANPLNDVARQHGEELVLVDNSGHAIASKSNARLGASEYKAQSGDSLSKMASRLMGSNSKANRDAIVAANPSLKNDPNKVIVGRTYVIPNVSTSNAEAAPAQSTQAEQAQSSAKEIAEYWYTVKAGDSLWKIAADQLGKPGAMAAIKELNKDALVGPEHDQVVLGSKLRLPSKPIAQSN